MSSSKVLDREDTYARVLFTDFSKGFDLVDHHALLQELEILGVHDCLIRWIKAFLCDRQQRVRIDGILSPPISPRGGIPQGTRLAPLLFAVLVNRLAEDWRLWNFLGSPFDCACVRFLCLLGTLFGDRTPSRN